ncbi:MAG TPA: medium chain dehydrogenase/reductase family protein [Dongiaceae bacterium]|nr:medium chain dehydrogenase/reductase family protein [Dongiaceae bacterium]
MKRIVITRHGGPDVLQVQESPDPKPRAGEVLIRVKAAGLNFADVLARKGLYPDAPSTPCTVGYEVAGVVEAVGGGAGESWLGQDVIALTRFNGQSELIVVPATQVFAKPAAMSFELAASIPVNYLTAWQLLVAMGGLQKDESVLIHNAGGGVGLAAIDIASHIGATIYGTASAGKHAFLKERGLHHPIDYRNNDWGPVLDRLTEGKGVDLITDPIGGDHFRKSYKHLRSTGRLGMFGISTVSDGGGKLALVKMAVTTPIFHPFGLMNSNKGAFGVNMGHLWHEQEKIRRWTDAILQGYEEGWIRPHVDRVFSFSQAADAHRHLENRGNTGKVVLVP